MIKYQDCLDGELSFSWSGRNGEEHMWLTGRMIRAAEHYHKRVVCVGMDVDFARWVAKSYGIEQHRYDRITPEAIMKSPVVYVRFPDDSHTLVDGAHRYLKAAVLGWTGVPAYVFSIGEADQFEIEIPSFAKGRLKEYHSMDTFSGIS